MKILSSLRHSHRRGRRRSRLRVSRAARLALIIGGGLLLSCGKEPAQRDILGLRLSMTKAKAEKGLQEIGTFVRPDRRRQEVWQLRNTPFAHVIVGYEKEGSLRFITAVARTGEKAGRVAYGAAGSLETARQLGKPEVHNFNFQWELPAKGGEPATRVMARGTDPQFLSNWSLVRIEEGAAAHATDEEDDE